MGYPLQIRFKVVALALRIFVGDAQSKTFCHLKQELFKLKQDTQRLSDAKKSRHIASIKANQIIDWSLRCFFSDRQGHQLGSAGRQGMESIWRARNDVFEPGSKVSAFKVQEEKSWSNIMGCLLAGIPIVGFLTGYAFHPTYLASRPDGTPAMRARKQSAFWEGKVTIEKLADFAPKEEANLSYLLRSGPQLSNKHPEEVLARCPIDGITLYCDGQVKQERNH
jgi:hypothetical protein